MNGKKCLLFIIGFLCFSYNLFGYTLDNPSDTTITETDISDGILIIQNNNQPNITITLPADITLTTLQIYGNNLGSCIIQIQGNTVINSLILGFDLSQSAANVTFSSTTSENLSIGTLDTTYNSWNASDEKSITIDSNITATINTWNLHDTPGMGNSTPVSFTNNGTTSINNIVINDDSSNVTISGTGNISVTGEVQGNNAEDFISQVSDIVDIPSSYTELTYKNGDWFYVTPTEDFARTPNANTKKLIINENASLDISTLTALEEILINNGATFDILTNSINTSVLNTTSNGTIKTTGTVTVPSDTTYTSSNLSIQANVISLQNSNLTINKVTVANASFTGDCIVDAETEISSGINAISSPNIIFKKSVVFSGMSPMVEDISSLIFEKNVTAFNDIAFSGIQNLVINSPSKITAGNNLTFRDNNNISGTFETGTGTIKFGDYNGTETTTISEDTTLNGDVTNADTIKINSGKKLNLTKNFDDSIGTVTGDATGTGIIYFTGSENQTFTPNTSTTYKNIVVDKTGGTLTVDSALKIENFTITNATQTTFNGTINITNFTDTANAGDIEFTDDVRITSATTMQTSGTVILANGKTLEISDGALPPTFYNFTQTAGNTELNGEITAANISLGQIKVPSSIATNTANVTLTSSTGNFTLGTIGEESKTFADVTLNAGSNEITLNGNQIYSSEVNISTTNEISLTNVQTSGNLNLFANNVITLTRVKVSGIVDFNTTAKVTLTGGNNNATALSVDSLNFTSTPSEISLSGQITSTGANGFILPNVTTTLTGNTTLTTTTGPITLYDNIDATNRDLTIINAGTFTLNDTENPTNDPLTMADTPISQMQVRNFTQDGNGSVVLSGDINTTGTVTFTKAIILADNVSISSTQDISIKESISRTTNEELKFTITDTTKSVIFSGTGASINVPITVNGNLQNIGAVNYNAALTVTGNVTNAGTWNGTGNVDINGNVTNSNSSAWNGNGDITLTGNFTDNGTWTGTGDITLSGTANQTFIAGKTGTNPTTYTKIIVNKTTSGKASFNTNALNVTEIDIQGNADFNSAVNINTLTNTFTSGDILFAAGGVIKSDTTFATTGEVNFSGTAGTQFTFADGGTNVNFTHTAGQTNIDGVEITALTLSLGLSNIENSTITGDINTNDTITITNSNQTGDFTNNDNATISDFTLTGDFTNNATVSVSNFTQTGDFNNFASATFTISDNSTLNGNFTNNATATVEIAANKTFYLSKNFTNNGTFTAGNNSTFALIDKTNNTTIQGTSSPTFYHFKAINKDGNGLGGKTLTLNTDITVINNLILKGTSNESLLTIKDDGSGKGFLLSASQPANADDDDHAIAVGNFLAIGPTVKIKNSNIGDDYDTTDGLEGILYKADNSVPLGTFTPSSPEENLAFATVILNGWRIKKLADLSYIWKGTDASNPTEWDNSNNWTIPIVPGKIYTRGANVIIPDECDNYPILTNTSFTIKTLVIGGVPSATNPAILTLSGNSNLKVTGTTGNALTNNTIIKYLSTGRIVNNANIQINDSQHGTVEYDLSDVNIIEISNVEYNNLILVNGKFTTNNILQANIFEIQNNCDIVFNQAINCSEFIVSDSPVIEIKKGLKCTNGSILIPNIATLSLGGTIVTGTDNLHSFVQQYDCPFMLNDDALFISGTNIVVFSDIVDSTGSNNYSITVGDDSNETNFVTYGNIGNIGALSTLKVYGSSVIASDITTIENQTYNGAVTLNQNTTLLAGSNKVIFNSTVDSSSPSNYALTIGNSTLSTNLEANGIIGSTTPLSSLTVFGTSTISKNITTTDSQTFKSATILKDDITFSSASSKLILFENTLSGVSLGSGNHPNITINVADVQFDGAVSNIKDITTAANVTFNGTVNSTGNITTLGTSALSTFNNTVNTLGKITSNGATTVNSHSITSNGEQLFVGDLTINVQTQFTSNNADFTSNRITSSASTTIEAKNINFNDDSAFTSVSPTNSATLTLINENLFTLAQNQALTCDSLTQKARIINGTPSENSKNMIAGNITLSGDPNNAITKSTFGTAVYIYGSTDTLINGTLDCKNNLIIAKDTETQKITLNLSNTVTSTAKNIVLYSGTLQINENFSSSDDVVLFGSNYSDTDHVSATPNAYSYENERFTGENDTKTGAKNSYPLETQFPTGVSIPQNKGKLVIASGKKIITGKNFYANGLSITGDIQIPQNTDSTQTFAEAYNCVISSSTVSSSTASGLSQIASENCTFNGTNVNWDNEDLEITKAYTVRDNVVYVEFNREIRNLNNEIQRVLENGFITLSNNKKYVGVYEDADCQVEVQNKNSKSFYLKVEDSGVWNTDATGTNSGDSNSTDRNGIHKNETPFIDIVRNHTSGTKNFPWLITDIYGKRLVNYSTKTPSSSSVYDKVEDHTGPVLYQVKTGQENHSIFNGSIGPESQPSYDSHNFIEFRYSEPVNFGDASATGRTASDTSNIFDNSKTSSADIGQNFWLPANAEVASSNPSSTVNIRVNTLLGAVNGNITQEDNITLTNLATFEKGKIHTGSNGSNTPFVNTIYRLDKFTIRYSIAGYTEGTVFDQTGNEYKKWIGYIESASMPSGKVTLATNETVNDVKFNKYITDCAKGVDGSGNEIPLFNKQEEYKANLTKIPEVDSTDSGVYGKWDLSEPIFAPCSTQSESPWSSNPIGEVKNHEAIGTNGGSGSTLQRIEFHFLDNTPDYSSNSFSWRTSKGWINSTGNLYIDGVDGTHCADIFGGSRPFSNDLNYRTTGGLRFSTVYGSSPSFKYIASQIDGVAPNIAFDNNPNSVFAEAKSSIFTGTSGTRRSADKTDGLYIGIQLADTSMPIDQTFTVSYDDTTGFITDLAGNRLRSAKIKTIDRTPPSYDFMLAPLNQNELFMVFVKNLQTSSDFLSYLDNNGNHDQIKITEEYENLIPQCFELFTMDDDGNVVSSTDLQIDTSIPAKINKIKSDYNGQTFTIIRLGLNKKITLQNIEDTYIRLILPRPTYGTSHDPFTGLNDVNVTFIQDEFGNYMQEFTAHSISDFAIGAVNSLYAYDQEMKVDENMIMNGLYEEGSWAVKDWNREQQNFGSLPANHPITIVADLLRGDCEATDTKTKSARLFVSDSQPQDAVSKQINLDLNRKLRIWFPQQNDGTGLFTSISQVNVPNTMFDSKEPEVLNPAASINRFKYELEKELTEKWGSGKQISFIFGLIDELGNSVKIYNTPYYDVANNKYNLAMSTPVPLYAVRLTNPNDILSLDLWSYKTKAIIEQRGGVTILNNVINVTNDEKTVIKVNLPSESKLNVSIMTIDGNIITYLQHGNTTSGEHYYSWNGKNENGTPVARGLYFIRIVGNGIDETRKVMVVK